MCNKGNRVPEGRVNSTSAGDHGCPVRACLQPRETRKI